MTSCSYYSPTNSSQTNSPCRRNMLLDRPLPFRRSSCADSGETLSQTLHLGDMSPHRFSEVIGVVKPIRPAILDRVHNILSTLGSLASKRHLTTTAQSRCSLFVHADSLSHLLSIQVSLGSCSMPNLGRLWFSYRSKLFILSAILIVADFIAIVDMVYS